MRESPNSPGLPSLERKSQPILQVPVPTDSECGRTAVHAYYFAIRSI
jgi:hypothetical protein